MINLKIGLQNKIIQVGIFVRLSQHLAIEIESVYQLAIRHTFYQNIHKTLQCNYKRVKNRARLAVASQLAILNKDTQLQPVSQLESAKIQYVPAYSINQVSQENWLGSQLAIPKPLSLLPLLNVNIILNFVLYVLVPSVIPKSYY